MAISKIRKLICSELTARCRQLTAIEKEKLAEHEAIIEKHLDAFYKVGFALMQIRDKGLFRETHDTFEDYVNDRWGFSRPRAYQLIKAVEVQDNLSTICRQTLTESVCRPLSKFTPEQQIEIFQIAAETAPAGGRVTAKHIEDIIEERLGLNAEELEKAGNEPARLETCVISSEDIRRAYSEMSEEELQARKLTEEDRLKERLEKEARCQKRDIARGAYIEQAFNRPVFFGKGQRLRGKKRKLFITMRRTAWFMRDFLRREEYRAQKIKTDLQGISKELGRDKFTTLLNQKYIKDFKTSPCIRDIIAILQLLGTEVQYPNKEVDEAEDATNIQPKPLIESGRRFGRRPKEMLVLSFGHDIIITSKIEAPSLTRVQFDEAEEATNIQPKPLIESGRRFGRRPKEINPNPLSFKRTVK